ncbi:MAG: hypothetical protein DSZ29_01545 [Aquificaceae bacterium]|nr:MAG: hypothetical protein DSZ29_01545 [Aquificaceae bacterium]
MMRKPLLVLFALVAIALIAFYSTYIKKVPVAIEKDIAARAQARFQRAGMSWVKAKVSGRNITLVGVAPNHDAMEMAEKMVRVEGYGSIDNQLTVAKPVLASRKDGFDYNLHVHKSEQKKIILTGVLNKNSHKLIVDSAVQQYGRNSVTDQIQIKNVMTPDFVGQSFELVMQQLGQLKKGSVEFSQFNFMLKGTFPANISSNNFKQRINERWVVKPVRSTSLPMIRAPRNKPFRQKTEADIKRAKKCRADLRRIAVSSIRFKTGSTIVTRSSYRVLNKIAAIAKRCDDFNLQIHGHTDSIGNAEKNEKLSYGRAFTVVKYLASKHIGLNRLEALGHGASKPIASNRTKRGRAKNRRIEITMREQY